MNKPQFRLENIEPLDAVATVISSTRLSQYNSNKGERSFCLFDGGGCDDCKCDDDCRKDHYVCSCDTKCRDDCSCADATSGY